MHPFTSSVRSADWGNRIWCRREVLSMKANYLIVEKSPDHILIEDLGPWDRFKTVTNAAEEVVAEMLPILNGRRLEYIDSNGDRAVLLIVDGKFAGFGWLEP